MTRDEYKADLLAIRATYPMMTIQELAAYVSRSPGWVADILDDKPRFALEFFQNEVWIRPDHVELKKADSEEVRVQNTFPRKRATLWASRYLELYSDCGIRIVELK